MTAFVSFLILLSADGLFSENLSKLNCDSATSVNSHQYIQCHYGCKTEVECKRLSRSLFRDSKRGCLPGPRKVASIDQNFSWLEKNFKQVAGTTFFAGVVPGRYGYWMYSRNNKLVIHTTVHFKNFDQLSDFHQDWLQKRFNQAAKIWEQHNPFDFPIRFAFKIVRDPKRAFIKNIKLKSRTNGPYFARWNVNWSPRTIAHEFGHVLGLDDEYSYLINSALKVTKRDNICEASSFMCRSSHWNTEIKNYHYYMVLRRLHCS